ncbi:9835_t:CDS:1, partial [Gigaspora margarita]
WHFNSFGSLLSLKNLITKNQLDTVDQWIKKRLKDCNFEKKDLVDIINYEKNNGENHYIL